jgi:hypothetical protein
VDDQAHRAWARTVKYYENLKVVYQLKVMLSEWQQQQDEDPAAATQGSNRKAEDRKLPVKTSPSQTVEPDLKNSGGAPAPAGATKPPAGSR